MSDEPSIPSEEKHCYIFHVKAGLRDCQGRGVKKTAEKLSGQGISNVDMIKTSDVVFKSFTFSVV